MNKYVFRIYYKHEGKKCFYTLTVWAWNYQAARTLARQDAMPNYISVSLVKSNSLREGVLARY